MDHILGPITLVKNEAFGRHFISTRLIQPGEIVLTESSIYSYPWSLDKTISICLSCCKNLEDELNCNKCQHCQWPVCNLACANATQHSNFECKILADQGLAFDQLDKSNAYYCIQTLRGLLLREKSLEKFKALLELESHLEGWLENWKEITSYIIDFIHNKCKLKDIYDVDSIKQIFGATEVNSFTSTSQPGEAFVCIALNMSSMFSHSCSPNTSRIICVEDNTGRLHKEGDDHTYMARFSASRLINPGEMVTINYGDINAGVTERRERLKRDYFFDCYCERCTQELNHTNVKGL